MNFARVDSADAEELIIGAGEVVLLPRNDLHLIGSDLSLPPVAGVNIIHALKGGGLTRSSFPAPVDGLAVRPRFRFRATPAGGQLDNRRPLAGGGIVRERALSEWAETSP